MTRPPERLKNMKLPTAPFPANLQEMGRQGVKPLKRLSGRVLKKIQHSVGPKLDGKNPFKAVPSATDVKDSKGSKVLLNLLLVRPWVLVLGFWLLSMATGTLALSGMLSPRKLKMALPEPALNSGASTQSNALLNTAPKQAGDATAEVSETAEAAGEMPVIEVGATDAAEEGAGFPALPILALVGSCAAGSLVISRRRAMVRMAAARAQGRKRKSRPSVPVGAPARVAREGVVPARTATVANRGLRPKKQRRQRVRKSPVAAQSVGTGSRALVSRATAQQKNTVSQKKVQKNGPHVVQKVARSVRSSSGRTVSSPTRSAARVSRTQARRSAMRAASRRQPMVSVVPANESHALDWTRGSLAHQLDVRPHRSAM